MNKLRQITLVLIFCLAANVSFAQKTLESAKKLTAGEQFTLAEEEYKALILANKIIGDNYYYYGNSEISAFFSDTITRSLTQTYDKCKVIFENGIKNDTANHLNEIGMARVEYLMGNTSKVDEYLKKVNASLPLFTEKIKKIKKIMDPKRYALMLTEMAKIYIVIGKTDTAAALPLLRRAKLADPTNANIFITAGDAYLNVRDVNKAIENYNLAQSLDPQSPLAKFKIGYMYFRAQNLSEAIKFFEESLSIDPNFAPTYKELGFLYYLSGKQDKSKQNYEKYLELSGNNIPAKISYVVSLFKSADYKACIAQINEIFAIDSTINSMNRVIAYSYFEDKQFKMALYFMEKFFANTTPEDIINKDYIYYGKILGANNFGNRSEEQFRKALAINPALVELYGEIAKYQRNSKNFGRVAIAYEEKIALGAGAIDDYYNLGKTYYSDAKYTLADSIFNVVLDKEFGRYINYKILCYSWQGFARVKIDTAFSTGYAKPVYEKLIEEAKLDSAKNVKYLVEAYSYLAYYYLVNPEFLDFCASKRYFNLVLAIEPKNAKALLALSTKELSTAKCPEDEQK